MRIALAVAMALVLGAGAQAQVRTTHAPTLQPEAQDQTWPESGHSIGLANGIPVEDIALATDGVLEFFIDVPPASGHLVIQTSGGTGDADIYVGYAFEPTLVEFDCVGWLAGNDERCWFPIPDTGRYHILLHAYAAIEGVSLVAGFSDERPEVQPLANGQPVAVAVPAGSMNYYAFVVEEGSSHLVVEMSGGPDTTGDSELYVRFGAPPVQDEFYWDCRPWIDGNDETCVFENPEPGLWYAGVEAWHAFGDVTDVSLVATWNTPATGVPGNLQVTRTGARMRPAHTLAWSGGGDVVDVWLDGTRVHQGANTGGYTQRMLAWQLPATWQVCNAGTTECSAEINAR